MRRNAAASRRGPMSLSSRRRSAPRDVRPDTSRPARQARSRASRRARRRAGRSASSCRKHIVRGRNPRDPATSRCVRDRADRADDAKFATERGPQRVEIAPVARQTVQTEQDRLVASVLVAPATPAPPLPVGHAVQAAWRSAEDATIDIRRVHAHPFILSVLSVGDARRYGHAPLNVRASSAATVAAKR